MLSTSLFSVRPRFATLVGDEATQVVFDADVYPAVGAVADA